MSLATGEIEYCSREKGVQTNGDGTDTPTTSDQTAGREQDNPTNMKPKQTEVVFSTTTYYFYFRIVVVVAGVEESEALLDWKRLKNGGWV